MTSPTLIPTAVAIDCYGVTDKGRVRERNEDHFVIAALGKSVEIVGASLSGEALAHRFGRQIAHLLAVADGVGGGPAGDKASERTVSTLLGYVGRTADCFHGLDTAKEHDLLTSLEAKVRSVHEELLEEYGGPRSHVPATTLTMALLVWPRAYLVHVGDSRAYVYRRGRLQRLTRDQTLGEYMVAAGAWTEQQAAKSGPASALASAIGGSDITPVLGIIDLEPGDSLLLCTDGLCKHVNDERISALMAERTDARTASQRLLDEALAAGGTDNVTVVVARTGTTAAG